MRRECRICNECDTVEIQYVCHWLVQCSAWNHLRQPPLEASSGMVHSIIDRCSYLNMDVKHSFEMG